MRDMKQSGINAMYRQVMSLPDLIVEQADDLETKARRIVRQWNVSEIEHIVITGCGDSKFAGIAVKSFIESITGVRTEVISAIDLSRHDSLNWIGSSDYNTIVVALSNSGSPARVAEAAERTKKHGAHVLGITGNKESRLAKACTQILELNVSSFESAPGVRGYFVAMLALMYLGIQLCEERGKCSGHNAEDLRQHILHTATTLTAILPELDAQMREMALNWRGLEAFDFIAAGDEEAAALFGQAKIFEALGRYAMINNTEEFMHLNCFMEKTESIGTILICSGQSESLSRAQEVAQCIAIHLKRPFLIITDNRQSFDMLNVPMVVLPSEDVAVVRVLYQFVPIALLVAYLMLLSHEKMGRGFEGKWSFCADGGGTTNSLIKIL